MCVLFSDSDIGKEILKTSNKLDAASLVIESAKASQIKGKAGEVLKKLVGEIAEGKIIEYCSAGEFSMHQLLQYLLSCTGAANVYLSTWTIKEEPARVLHYLIKEGVIKNLYCVLDYRIRTLDAKHFDFIEKTLTKYVLTKCHAKVMAIEGERMCVTVVSSANMSNNPRIEAGYINCSKESMEFHKGWIMGCIAGKKIYE